MLQDYFAWHLQRSKNEIEVSSEMKMQFVFAVKLVPAVRPRIGRTVRRYDECALSNWPRHFLSAHANKHLPSLHLTDVKDLADRPPNVVAMMR